MYQVDMQYIDIHPDILNEWDERIQDHVAENRLDYVLNPGPVSAHIEQNGALIISSSFTDGYILSFKIQAEDWYPNHTV